MQNVNKGQRRTISGVLVAAGLLILSKLKWVLALLKFSKLGGTLISMIISLGAYAVFYGWRFAAVLVYLLFIHEMGHLIAAKQKGIKTSPAIFIPFAGAVIGMKETPKDAATEAFLAYGGPLAGLLSTLPPLAIYAFTHDPFWALAVMLGAMINLFNLFPVSPLDGGRIVGVLSPHLWFLGLIGLAVYAFFFPSPIIILIIILGFFSWWQRVREDFTIKSLQLHIQAKRDILPRIAELKHDIFYPFHTDEEDGPMVNEAMKGYLKWPAEAERRELIEQLRAMKGWYFPFIQDKKKLEKREREARLEALDAWLEVLDRANEPRDIDTAIERVNREIEKLEAEIRKMNQYYNAPAKTRAVTFVAYILLAAVLGLMYIYAKDILDNYYWYNNPLS